MKLYSIPVNSDLTEVLDLSFEDAVELTGIMHNLLESEYIVRLTGGVISGSLNVKYKPSHIRDFLYGR